MLRCPPPAALLAGAWLLGCGSSGGVDAGIDIGDAAVALRDAAEPMPAPPAPPAPIAWPCPAGWAEVELAGAHACEPWPSDWTGCPAGERRFVGDAACAPFESDCPAGDWPGDLPASGVRYVLAGAAPGGSGTRAAPFATVTEAMAAATDGETIAIGPGTYDESLLIERPVTLRGACPAATVLNAVTAGGYWSTIWVATDGVTVEGLTVTGDRPGIRAQAAALSLRRVVVSGVPGFGVVATAGGAITADELVVRGVRVEDSGAAVTALDAGRIEIHRGIVEDDEGIAFLAADEGTELTLTDVAVRRTLPRSSAGDLGSGLAIGRGAHLAADRVVVEDSRAGAFALQEGGAAELRDVVIRDTAGQASDGTLGIGVNVTDEATLRIERGWLDGHRGAALTALQRSSVEASDLIVTRTRESDDFARTEAAGVLVDSAGAVTLSRAYFEGNQGVAIVVHDWFATVTLEDVTVRDTRATSDGLVGRALNITAGATATAERFAAVESHESAIVLSGEMTELTLRDATIRATRSRPMDRQGGRGITCIAGPRLTVERALFEGNREAGLLLYGTGTVAALTDVRVERTEPGECEVDTCRGAGGGSGIAIVEGAELTLTRFITRGNALAGLQIARGASVEVREGLVAQNVVGVNVQEVELSLDALTEGVIYRDNGVNLDASDLPLPDPGF